MSKSIGFDRDRKLNTKRKKKIRLSTLVLYSTRTYTYYIRILYNTYGPGWIFNNDARDRFQLELQIRETLPGVVVSPDDRWLPVCVYTRIFRTGAVRGRNNLYSLIYTNIILYIVYADDDIILYYLYRCIPIYLYTNIPSDILYDREIRVYSGTARLRYGKKFTGNKKPRKNSRKIVREKILSTIFLYIKFTHIF